MRERDMLGSLLVLLQDPWLFSTDHPSAICMPLTPCYGAFASEPVLPNINLKRTFAPCKWSEILLECCRFSKVVINDSIRATLFERSTTFVVTKAWGYPLSQPLFFESEIGLGGILLQQVLLNDA